MLFSLDIYFVEVPLPSSYVRIGPPLQVQDDAAPGQPRSSPPISHLPSPGPDFVGGVRYRMVGPVSISDIEVEIYLLQKPFCSYDRN